ncbi:DeoR family regulatory protein [Streptococcus varani]|jgi:DeoR/GlpR family transcriptional regulator of sugar metabolism|uniref:DeoR family regulatory protein n=1 Tax=Streptococcus varani TaxID=1608583 RepID=A0A0E4H333_9STRE|nr:DeoR/GlpR family DNA-binding transcription regulator [Streptococcus varani]CQR23735.1 DeoR family regulatory protein [Streptococcus varani]
MYPEERHRKILDILSQQKNATVNELSKALSVSVVTIRNDLNFLSDKKLIHRLHGGASLIETGLISTTISYDFRSKKNSELKKIIAKKAIETVVDNECIIIDASSTAYELARLINERNLRLTVITNGIMTAELLKDNPNITTILLGGILKGRSNAIESTLGAALLKNMNITQLFISAQSLNFEDGMSDFNLYEVELKKIMVEQSKRVIALVDSTKIETKSVATFLDFDNIDLLITDNQIPSTILESYKQRGLVVI